MIVSNIGVVPDFSALYTTNAGPYTATIQMALKDDPQDRQLRIHGPRRSEHSRELSRAADILHQRIDGGRRAEHAACRRPSTSR